MKNRYRIQATCLLVIFLSSLALTSCSAKQGESSKVAARDSAAFLATEISIPAVEEGSWGQGIDVCLFQSSVVFLQNTNDANGGIQGEVILMETDGSVQNSLLLKTETGEPLYGTALYVNDDCLYVLAQDPMSGGTELLKLASDGQSVAERTLFTLDGSDYCSDFLVVDDTCVLLCGQTLLAYKDGVLLGQSAISGSLFVEQIAEDGGAIEYLYGDVEGTYMGRWNYSTGGVEKLAFTALTDVSLSGWSQASDGFYVETMSGIYQIDGEKDRLNEVLSWNDTDLPPTRYVYNITNDYVLSQDLVIRVVSPVSSQNNETPECQVLQHTDINPSAGKTILTIGGYYAAKDTILQYAVYRFNMSNSTYRFEIRDYAELYPFSDIPSYDRAIANIIADMSNGKGTDILYGNLAFNYNKLAENGLLLDMKPYLDKDTEISEASWLPSIYNLMEKNGSLYFFFPAFSIKGYLTNQDYFPQTDTITCRDVLKKKSDTSFSGTVFSGVKSADLLRGALLYSLDNYRDASGKFNISSGQLEELVEYARQAGTLDTSVTTSNPEQSYLLGQQAMLYSYISCPQDYYRYQQLGSSPSIYVGYPSQEESARLCTPLDIVEISSGTKYPDACWDFVKIMMSSEVQQKALEINSIPVSREGFEALLNKAEHPELRSSAENTALDMTVQTAIPADSIADFRALVDSISTLEYYDTSLSAIIDEACAPCLNGDKSAQDVVSELNQRVNLYLEE